MPKFCVAIEYKSSPDSKGWVERVVEAADEGAAEALVLGLEGIPRDRVRWSARVLLELDPEEQALVERARQELFERAKAERPTWMDRQRPGDHSAE